MMIEEDMSDRNARRIGSRWLWLAAGLLSAIVIPMVLNRTLPRFTVPLPPAYEVLSNRVSNMVELTDEQEAAMVIMRRQTGNANQRLLLISAGVPLALIFGWFAGMIAQRRTAALGAFAGAAMAIFLAWAVSQPILELQSRALADKHGGDTTAMAMHGIQWAVLGLAVFGAVLVSTGQVSISLRVLGVWMLAATLGGTLYVIGVAMWDPANHTSNAEPVAGVYRLLWSSVPPALAGLFLARSPD